MKILGALILAALLATLGSAGVSAKGPAVQVEVVYQFASPSGGTKVWKVYPILTDADHARVYCDDDAQQPHKNEIKYYVANHKELAGHTFVSAACTKKGGDYWISTSSIGAPNMPDPAGVAMYFVDAAGVVHPSLLNNPAVPMSMTQCLDQLRSMTSEYKTKLKKVIVEFGEIEFVSSECVFVDGFKY